MSVKKRLQRISLLILVLASFFTDIVFTEELEERHLKMYKANDALDVADVLHLSQHSGKLLKKVTLKYNMIRSELQIEWIVDAQLVGRSVLSKGLYKEVSYDLNIKLPSVIQIKFIGESGMIQTRELLAVVEDIIGETAGQIYTKQSEAENRLAQNQFEIPTPASQEVELINSRINISKAIQSTADLIIANEVKKLLASSGYIKWNPLKDYLEIEVLEGSVKITGNLQFADLDNLQKSIEALEYVKEVTLSVIPEQTIQPIIVPKKNQNYSKGEYRFLAPKYDVLIICPDKLKSSEDIPGRIKRFKESVEEYKVDLKYLDDIYNSTNGYDEAEKIKKYIYNHTKENLTKYVILLGDSDLMPVRYVAYPTSLKKKRILSSVYARIKTMLERSMIDPNEDVGGHLNFAMKKNNKDLKESLRRRIRDAFIDLSIKNNINNTANFYTQISLYLNSFGVDFGNDIRNSMDANIHYNWASSNTTSHKQLTDEIWNRIDRLFDTIEKSNVSDAAWLYTADSVWLASEFSQFNDSVRFSLDPSVHFTWAKNQNPYKLAEEFISKAVYVMNKSGDSRTAGAKIAHRLRWHGFLLGGGIDDSNSLAETIAWAKNWKKNDEFIEEIKARINRSYSLMVLDYFWIPSDLYYSCIYKDDFNFDSWDDNKNGIYGEIDIIETGGSLHAVNKDKCDFIPDVTVGRVPVSNRIELAFYYDKIRAYNGGKGREKIYSIVSCMDKKIADSDIFIKCADLSQPFSAIKYETVQPVGAELDDEIHLLYQEMNKKNAGIYLISSHGSPTSMTGILSTNNPKWLIDWKLDNKNALPFLWANSCYVGRFAPISYDNSAIRSRTDEYLTTSGNRYRADDRYHVEYKTPQPAILQSGMDVDSLVEHLMVKGNDGVIGMIASEFATNLGSIKSFSKIFLGILDESITKKSITYGDIITEARKKYIKEKNLPDDMDNQNLLKHLLMINLFGDPSIKAGNQITFYKLNLENK